MRKPLSIDGDMTRRFLDLLDPDHDQFLFAVGDDNQERAKAVLKAGKSPWADHRKARRAQVRWLEASKPRPTPGSTGQFEELIVSWPKGTAPGAMTGLWGRRPIWDLRSPTKRWEMFCDATVCRPRRSASARPHGRPSFGPTWRAIGVDRLFHGRGADAAQVGDLLL